MTTTIISTNNNGSRRCDTNCHNATSIKCQCICDGAFHGVGSENIPELLDEITRPLTALIIGLEEEQEYEKTDDD